MTIFSYTLFILAVFPYCLLLSYILGSLSRKKPTKVVQNKEKQCQVPVSIILACFNEEKHIHQKITSFLDESNWIAGSEIIIVSGGSTDKTNEKILHFKDNENVHIHLFKERISKIRGINIAVSFAEKDILLFSDFRQEMKPGSIPNLISNFSDPEIGAVAGTLVDSKNGESPSLIRSLLNKIAINARNSSSSLNIFGALYAQRKEYFRIIPEDILFEDLFVMVSILGQNTKLVQEQNAVIYDYHFSKYYDTERIMRLARGLLLFLFQHPDEIRKIPPKIRTRFLIFKYLKLLFPCSLLCILLSLALLLTSGEYILPLSFGILAILLLLFTATRKGMIHFIKFHFYFGLATTLFLTGSRSVFWEKLKIDR